MKPSTSAATVDTAGNDHDQPYTFGRKPTVLAPFPFTTRQLGRLLVLRGRVQDTLHSED